jgi:hypothetical protein
MLRVSSAALFDTYLHGLFGANVPKSKHGAVALEHRPLLIDQHLAKFRHTGIGAKEPQQDYIPICISTKCRLRLRPRPRLLCWHTS